MSQSLNSSLDRGSRLSEYSVVYREAKSFQKYAAILALLSAFAGWMLIIDWTSRSQSGQNYLGGLNFNRQLFNLHPVFMYGGMVFAFTAAIASFRLIPLPKPWVKSIHVLCHTLAIICIICGLICVFVSNNYESKNDEGIYYSNLYSLHSFIGLATIILYFQNYILGIFHFLSSITLVPAEKRKFYLPIHVCLGVVSFILAIVTVETGIMELFVELGCGYSVTSADLNPADNYHLLTYGCQLANGAAILTILVAITGFIALYRFPADFLPKNEMSEKLLLNDSEITKRTSSIQMN